MNTTTPIDPLMSWPPQPLYLSFAERAVECERRGAWTEAALLWQVASENARHRDNIRWAQGRAEYCRHQSGDKAPEQSTDTTGIMR
ncbi:ANR family transcriptional regulator [Serratia rhizosphaerae]|uniref:ANR family transcriptional regulator n=1 Tax=Serratia rhizosphaerae TaxID=2597702 RepID=UPI002DBB439D|nr:ANR family transcriptional regulator [Serratia rhizosphaerae]MEB6338118.1 ANR family transcriptional regulator [Serratia rhizosphaerae]